MLPNSLIEHSQVTSNVVVYSAYLSIPCEGSSAKLVNFPSVRGPRNLIAKKKFCSLKKFSENFSIASYGASQLVPAKEKRTSAGRFYSMV